MVKILLAASFLLPLPAVAKSPGELEPVDLSILEKKDALTLYMSPSQKLRLVGLESALTDARSNLRSGQFLANTKPSSFAPDRDLKPIIERGKALIKEAQAAIMTNQTKLVELLEEVEAQQSQEHARAVDEYIIALETVPLEEALSSQSGQIEALLEACWALGYETLFFETIYIQESEGLRHAGSQHRNQAYDTLVQLDGNNFTVKVPTDFQLKADTRGSSHSIFSYDNAALFEKDRKALLIFECIVPDGSSTGLLSLRAVDLNTQKIVVQELVKIEDLSSLLPDQTIEGLKNRIPVKAQLRDRAQTIELLSQLSEPYAFQVTDPQTDWVANAFLTQILLRHSQLELVDSAFILRAYGDVLDQPEYWQGQANAQIAIESSEVESDYQVQAQAANSDRILDVGTLTLGEP